MLPRSMASLSPVDTVASDWNLVFKIKYGDVLRRYIACVRGRTMDFTMESLRSKIISLFNFKPDADFTITYIDEDNDVVMLVDDNDLRDATILQRLNPLRITVQLNSNITDGNSETRTPDQGSAISFKATPKIHSSVEFLKSMPEHVHLTGSHVEGALKLVPESVRTAISKISGDLQSLVSTSALSVAELADHLLNSLFFSETPTSGGPDAPSREFAGAYTRSNVRPSSSRPATVPDVLPPSFGVIVESNNRKPDSGSTLKGIGTSFSVNPVDNNVPSSTKAVMVDRVCPIFPVLDNAQPEKDGLSSLKGKYVTLGTSSIPSIEQTDVHTLLSGSYKAPRQPTLQVPTGAISDALCGSQRKHNCSDSGPFASQAGNNMQDGAPVNPVYANPSVVTPTPRSGYSRRKSFTHLSYHAGVYCDGCGMHPIMGPRYKSKVKENYDLCSICFSTMGDAVDYIRIDHTIRSRGLYPRCKTQMLPSRAFRCGVKPSKVKLESRFIQDVSIMDGTLMAPGTRFTKIWRMCNNGNVEWPSGTQLVWIGGDKLGDKGSVLLDIPSEGFPIGGEFDVAVDFTAPSRPGRYTSSWKMAAPSGHKFGQRVWVSIQVDHRFDPIVDSFHGGLNLNLPPEINRQEEQEIVDVNAKFYKHGPCAMPSSSNVTQPLTDDGLLVSGPPVKLPQSESPLTASYPLIDLSVPPLESPPLSFDPPQLPPPMTTANHEPSGFHIDGIDSIEETLLKELDEMGFKEINLNKEILRLNEYNLEQSLDYLCGISKWESLH
ncbi:hypothetical protein QJS10_CPB04g01495 [Acorus calamus]|uniref:Protein NBR1 homolog n=1 Tax=Acorus calamus TaxID=4465 RepID=A0AAV9F1M6_ACOCL|nr:hypothetical protein QJS10_CPB04g01495 [Acorus calamus]